ncbi:MAG: hypothetical protein JXR63_13570, partial [Spirochaetales bacterium]|nr:hypothetical protein [Spirochaetales bacterium]
MRRFLFLFICFSFISVQAFSSENDQEDLKVNLPKLEEELAQVKKQQEAYRAVNITGALLALLGISFLLADSLVGEDDPTAKNGPLSYAGASFVGIGGVSCIVFSILYFTNEERHQKLESTVNYYRNLEEIIYESKKPDPDPEATPDSDTPGTEPEATPDSDTPGTDPEATPDSDAPGTEPEATPDSDTPGTEPEATPDSDTPGTEPEATPDSDTP